MEKFPRHLRICEISTYSRARLLTACEYDFTHKMHKSGGREVCKNCEEYLDDVKAREGSYKRGSIYKLQGLLHRKNWDGESNI